MASRIAGITVEIDGNVTGLNKALESVNKTIKTTQSQPECCKPGRNKIECSGLYLDKI